MLDVERLLEDPDPDFEPDLLPDSVLSSSSPSAEFVPVGLELPLGEGPFVMVIEPLTSTVWDCASGSKEAVVVAEAFAGACVVVAIP